MDDRIGEACGVFGVYAPGQAVANLTYFGLFALQHRGQESAGIAVSDGETITVVKDMGLVTQVFDERRLAPWRATWPSATCATRPPGRAPGATPSPSTARPGEAGFALGHNGNLTNTVELAEELGLDLGHDRVRLRRGRPSCWPGRTPTRPRSDGRDLEGPLERVLPRLRGAFSLVLMDDARLIGVRDPNGFRPLVLGPAGVQGASAARVRAARRLPSEPDQLAVKLDPSTGIRIELVARPADTRVAAIDPSHMEFADEGGEGATPYQVLLHAAMVGETVRFTRQDTVEEQWRIMQPLLDTPPPVHTYVPGSWGPRPRRSRCRSRPVADPGRPMTARPASRRARPHLAVSSDRGLRVPLQLPYRCAVAPDGAIDWLCVPRFDSPSVFGSICSTAKPGSSASARSASIVPRRRAYEPGTNMRATTWNTPGGWVVVRDALTMGPGDGEDVVTPHTRPPADDDAEHMLVRTVECIDGHVEVELVCEPAFDYGRTPAAWTLVDGGRHAADASGDGQTLRLQIRHGARHRGQPGARPAHPRSRATRPTARCRGPRTSPRRPTSTKPLRASSARSGSGATGSDGPGSRPPLARPIQRSALTIKGLTYMPTGATVAALTDVAARDARAASATGTTATRGCATRPSPCRHCTSSTLDWEADEFMQFIADLEATEDGRCRSCTGSTAGATSPSRPATTCRATRARARFASATARSTNARTTSSARCSTRSCSTPAHRTASAAAVADRRDPGRVRHQGLARARPGHLGSAGAPQHYVSSKLMCWVALDRAAKLAEIRGDATSAPSGAATAEEIHADILAHGVTDQGVLRQHYATDALDASVLLAAIFGFLPPDDERLRATVLAIADDLTENGFVLRYRTDETDDGLSGKEGTFLICSFWLVSALAVIGELQEARDLMERLLRIASPLGLYAEEFDADTGRHLGNFPQAFSHLALIEAAARIIVPEIIAEMSNRT